MSNDGRKLIKDYFTAGLAVEEALDRREKARADLRAAAEIRCPEELARLDAASDALKNTEQHFAAVVMAIMGGGGATAASTRQFAIDHAASCDMESCPFKAMLAAEKAQEEAGKSKLN